MDSDEEDERMAQAAVWCTKIAGLGVRGLDNLGYLGLRGLGLRL